jgi:uncharacterized membrane protein YagU involved in acid resistance
VELIVVVVAGIAFGLVLARLIYVVVARAFNNLVDWAIANFGNPEAVERLERRRRGEG